MFEIAFATHSTSLLQSLLGRAMFLQCEPAAGQIIAATALIEQSLSDFGDADAILLLEPTNREVGGVCGRQGEVLADKGLDARGAIRRLPRWTGVKAQVFESLCAAVSQSAFRERNPGRRTGVAGVKVPGAGQTEENSVTSA